MMRIYFGLHTISTHSYPKILLYYVYIDHLAEYHQKSCTYNSTMSLVSSSPHENMLRPHTIITHPYTKRKFCFIKSTSTISPITTKILYIQQQNESSLCCGSRYLMRNIISKFMKKIVNRCISRVD